jgi:hypothetical protein
MDRDQLRRNIQAGRYADSDHIYYELGEYSVSANALAETSERVWVDTVGGYRTRWGL